MPRKVNIGLYSLSFDDVYELLLIRINCLQASTYSSVPLDFKEKFDKMSNFLLKIYEGVKTSIWNIDDLLSSY